MGRFLKLSILAALLIVYNLAVGTCVSCIHDRALPSQVLCPGRMVPGVTDHLVFHGDEDVYKLPPL